MAGRIASPLLIGRDDELALLARGYDEAAGGRGNTVLIGGEAGIGKSRLLAAAIEVARGDHAVVLLGGAVGLADGAMPFAPIVEALRPLGRMLDGGVAAAEVSAGVREAFAVVADELGLGGVTRTEGAGFAELRPDWARGRLYESVLELMRRLASERPVVLAIEDLHWADESTRELLLFLVRNARAERLLLVGTFRSDELHRRHPLLPWLAEVDRAPGTERVELRRLGRHDVERQLSEILGAAPRPDLVDAVFARSEGNPFYAEELIASGVVSQRLPTTLREVLSARLSVVSDTTLRVLGVAAIAGRRVDHELLLDVAGVPEAALLDALREATAAQLLTADDTTSDGYTFRHALIGEAAAETVLPGERRRLHVAIAEALERAPRPSGAEGAARLAEVAHHWMEARNLARAYRASLEAGEAAFEARAFAESHQQFERALELWDVASGSASGPESGGPDLVELRRLTGRAAYLAGAFQRAAAHLRSAVDAVDAGADPVRAGLLTERLGRALWSGGQLDPSMREYARAVELVPDDPPSADRARVLAGYGQVLMLAGRYSESLTVSEQARSMAAAVGARQIEGHAATTVGTDIALLGDPDRGVEIVRGGLAISMEVGDLDDTGRGHANLASVLEVAGRLDESIEVSLAGMRAMRQAGLGGTYGAFNQLNAATGLYELGRWDEALAQALEAERGAFGVAEVFAHQVIAQLRAGRGEFDEARRRAGQARELIGNSTDAQFNGPLGLTVLEIAAWTGDLDGGRRAADAILAMIRDTEDDRIEAELLTWVLRIEADIAERSRASRANADTDGAVDRANGFLARLDALAGRAGEGAFGQLLGSARAQGAAEAGRARGQSDAAAWGLAADVLKARGRVYRAAYATYRAAEARAMDRGNRAAAGALLAEARPVAIRLGAEPLRQAIDELAARARLTVDAAAPARGSAAPAAAGSALPAGANAGFDLTRRELEVLALLAAGRTNRQIAQQLFISESTAGVHVSNILGKLGVDGRVEAAAMAVRLGLAG